MKLIKFFSLPLLLSLLIISLSFNENLWLNVWIFLNVPSQLPVFSDFDSISKSLLSMQQGYNPYIENPNDISGGKYMYPSVWLHVFETLNLSNSINFILICFISIFSYFLCIFDLVKKIDKKYFTIFTIIFFFSTSNLLLIERLNIELIIFVFIYISLISKNILFKNIFFSFSIIGKIFPIFGILFLLHNKKNFLIMLIVISLFFFLFNKEIILLSGNIIEYALTIAYGVVTYAKAIYYYSVHFEWIINDQNYSVFKYLLILFFSFISFVLFIQNFKRHELEKVLHLDMNNFDFKEKLFMFGGGLYVGTFLISANLDYRLIFLLFTVPYSLSEFPRIFKIAYPIMCLIILNSILFEGGDRYSLFYFFKASLIHSIKLIIFVLLSIFLGNLLKKKLSKKSL